VSLTRETFEPAFRDALGDWHSEGRRKFRGLGQKLIVIAHALRVTPQHVSRLQHGKVMPSPILAARIEATIGGVRAADWGTAPSRPIETKLSVDRTSLQVADDVINIRSSKPPSAA
jgi:hypothetical protein